jgi:hypothetical protein
MDFVKEVEDGSLDFVFIDGNHSFEAVREDLGAWPAKIKKGGEFWRLNIDIGMTVVI